MVTLQLFGVNIILAEGAHFPFRARHPVAATVRFDGEATEGEAEPRAAHTRRVLRLHLLELPEDDFLILGRDAGAVVGDVKMAHQSVQGA